MDNEETIPEFINLTNENLAAEHLCCIIRKKTLNPGVEEKKEWLRERLTEGHVFRKLDVNGVAFIEYAPLETAWVPVSGDNYLYIYCLWTTGAYRGAGYGKELLNYCINDAKAKGKAGVCLIGADKQKAWLTDTGFAEKNGFSVSDTAPNGYRLYALSFGSELPRFNEGAKQMEIESKDFTVYYTPQCPYVYQSLETLKAFLTEKNVPFSFIKVNSLKQAKELPCVFNNFGVFYKGKFETVNLLVDTKNIERILKH